VVALGLVAVVEEGLSSVPVDGHWWDGYQVMFWHEDEISGILDSWHAVVGSAWRCFCWCCCLSPEDLLVSCFVACYLGEMHISNHYCSCSGLVDTFGWHDVVLFVEFCQNGLWPIA